MWRFAEDGAFVERECLLFEAGEYPDKGVTVTEDDLWEIVANSGEAIPVKIEHLSESPFDGVLGVVQGVRVEGRQLWGTLRQPIEAWRMVQKSGAKGLSVGLDMGEKRLVEISFVCHPRVARAQVFGEKREARPPTPHSGGDGRQELEETNRQDSESAKLVRFEFEGIFGKERGGRGAMTSIRQFAEGLMGYLRGVVSGEEESGKEGKEVKTEFAEEWSRLEAEKVRLREERATQQVVEWKRQGRLRATERAEGLARVLLVSGEESLVRFDGESVSLRTLFAAFMQENGHVVPMGEWIVADRLGTLGHSEGSAARERLIGLAQEKAGKEGLGYVQAFTAVATAHPDLAQAAREE